MVLVPADALTLSSGAALHWCGVLAGASHGAGTLGRVRLARRAPRRPAYSAEHHGFELVLADVLTPWPSGARARE